VTGDSFPTGENLTLAFSTPKFLGKFIGSACQRPTPGQLAMTSVVGICELYAMASLVGG
jgi:hypothetical protein